MTSDDFFLSNKDKFDVIFIDGLHIYEQVRKDVVNSINAINDGGWDHHSDLFNALRQRLPSWDQTVAALISDLDERGMLESTLVIALGEFGRTPTISTLSGQQKPGRDHWANAMSVLFAGGGCPGGQVVGATDRKGYAAVERVLSPENFASTIYRKLGIDPDMMLYSPQGRPSHIVSDGTPIKELMG